MQNTDTGLKTLVDQKDNDFQSLFKRMDTDKDLYYLKAYTMTNLDGRKTANVHNITLNRPALFASSVIHQLMSANQQVVVEGEKLKDKEQTYIEDFINDLLAQAGERLDYVEIADLFGFLCEQAALRGRIAGRCLMRMENGEFVPDILPLDTRYLTYELANDGLLWAAYKTSRTAALISKEYDVDITGGGIGSGRRKRHETVLDIWDREKNEVWIGGRKVLEQEHSYGYVPFVIQLVPRGSMLTDQEIGFGSYAMDSYKHKGESVFWLNRNLYPELNKAASILQTLNVMQFKAGLQYESEAGVRAEKPEGSLYGEGVVVPVEKGGGYKLMPIQDIHSASRLLYAMLDNSIQQGSLPAVEYGNLTFPLSAVAIKRLGTAKDKIFVPMLQALSLFHQKLSKMAIRQTEAIGQSVKIGAEGHKRGYDPSKLQGEYTISFKYFATSPDEDVANYSIAQAAREYLDEDTILRDILKLEDPDSVRSKRRADLAEQLDPAIALYRQAHSLVDEGNEIEARLVAERGVALIRQRMGQATPGQQGQTQRKGEGLLPLLEEGRATRQGGGGSEEQLEELSTEGLERKETLMQREGL